MLISGEKIKAYVGENSGGSHIHAAYSASKNVAITSSNSIDGTPAIGASVTLPPGRYILLARGVFNTGSSSGARNNSIAVYTGSSPTNGTIIGDSVQRISCASYGWCSMTTHCFVTPTSQTVYTVGLCSSMSSSSAATHIEAISVPNANNSGAQASHIGQIVQSTTLDTMAKVIEVYGGTTWIQHSGYMLYGATSNVVANSAVKTGGETTHTLTVNEMPNHSHKIRYTGGYANGIYGGMPGTSIDATPVYNDLIMAYEGGGQAHNNMPPYKNVYIWERTA